MSAVPQPSYRVRIRRDPRHKKQNLFVETVVKRKIIRAGRRFGKTVAAARIAVEAFLAGKRVLYVAPTSDQTGKFWKEVCWALKIPIDASVYHQTSHPVRMIELTSGDPNMRQTIICKTAWNADMLRGDSCDLLILDEWQLMNEDVWGVVGVPMLLDSNGDAVFIYTPPSLHSRSASKAKDPKHASRMFKKFEREMKRAINAGTKLRYFAMAGTSHDNPNLSTVALEEITEDMTELAYRQEIMAEEADEAPGAMWCRATLDKHRVKEAPVDQIQVAVGVDPPGGATECGIVGAFTAKCSCKGEGKEEIHGFVIEDNSDKVAPDKWGQIVVDTYDRLDADRVIAEINFGGDMVKTIIKTIDPNISYVEVHASRGKAVRAEPVAALYEQGKIHHVGSFKLLEDEQCEWVPGSTKSPNRMDALVWVLTYLMLKKKKRIVKWGPL